MQSKLSGIYPVYNRRVSSLLLILFVLFFFSISQFVKFCFNISTIYHKVSNFHIKPVPKYVAPSFYDLSLTLLYSHLYLYGGTARCDVNVGVRTRAFAPLGAYGF